MNSTTGLLHRINDPTLSVNERAQLRCQLAKQLELAWHFEAARKAMGNLWQRVGERPAVEGLDQPTRAEVLLRAGSLTGWIGSSRQIEGAQETAKNLITESITIFDSLKLPAKVATAQIDLAYCYWREGGFDDARVILQEALSRASDLDAESLALGVLRSGIVEQSAKRLHDSLKLYADNFALFEPLESDALKGKFHHEFAIVLRDLGVAEQRQDYLDRALIEFSAASVYFERANLSRHQACVENNLAMLYSTIGKFLEAHERVDRAQALFTSLKDTVHCAQVDDTRARVLIAQGEFLKAEKLINGAVRVLEEGGEQALLAEALTTRGIVLAGIKKYEQARVALDRAANVAEQAGDCDSAGLALITLCEHLGHRLSNEQLCIAIDRASTLLKDSRDLATVRRLERAKGHALFLTNAYPGRPNWSSFVLDEVLQRNECQYVQLALEDAHGSVTKAAELLGLRSHRSVNSILHRRCRHLLNLRTPIKPRRRRIIQADVDSSGTSPQKPKEARAIRILLVEDNDIVAGAVRETLETKGWAVETCSDGIAGLERIDSDTHYDLLLLDYDLPGVNGIELVHRARNLAHRSRTPIIVLSATPVEAAARKAGADEFLPKPKGVSSLVETISRLLGEPDEESEGG
jgi:CheY-like chemotaxis protein/tetratricopeptide (TPR) repeat protein